MGIRTFTEQDIADAEEIVYDIWSYELEGVSEALNRFIHRYLVRYYDVNRHYSFCLASDGLDAFLLAGRRTDRNASDEWFDRHLSCFSDSEKKVAQAYRHYLQRNSEMVRRFMQDGDIQMGLFVSRAAGSGRKLLDCLERTAREDGVSHLLLWADVTCNVPYYTKNGFVIVDRFENDMVGGMTALDTYVFRKCLD